MKQNVVDKILTIVLLLTAILVTIFNISKIPVVFRIVVLGLIALIYYWFHIVWGIDKLISKPKDNNKDD